jgi:16S rRNA (guanine966-N2)-methyltransferase
VRIVAGRWRGRSIKAPSGDEVRPTSDRVREAWMSIVAPSLPGALVLDLFSGSGALGLEALSRGAERVDFVEVAPRSLAALRANIEALGAEEGAVVHRADALRFIAPLGARAYDVAFADPPYKLGLAEQVAARWLESPFATLLGVEHFSHDRMPEGGDTRRYGSTSITLYRTGER